MIDLDDLKKGEIAFLCQVIICDQQGEPTAWITKGGKRIPIFEPGEGGGKAEQEEEQRRRGNEMFKAYQQKLMNRKEQLKQATIYGEEEGPEYLEEWEKEVTEPFKRHHGKEDIEFFFEMTTNSEYTEENFGKLDKKLRRELIKAYHEEYFYDVEDVYKHFTEEEITIMFDEYGLDLNDVFIDKNIDLNDPFERDTVMMRLESAEGVPEHMKAGVEIEIIEKISDSIVVFEKEINIQGKNFNINDAWGGFHCSWTGCITLNHSSDIIPDVLPHELFHHLTTGQNLDSGRYIEMYGIWKDWKQEMKSRFLYEELKGHTRIKYDDFHEFWAYNYGNWLKWDQMVLPKINPTAYDYFMKNKDYFKE